MKYMGSRRGFTLIELMVIITIIATLLALAVAQYKDMVKKAQDATAVGNLGAIRSAIRIYFGDTQIYPRDNLTILYTSGLYLQEIPPLKTTVHPSENMAVAIEVDPSEVASWSYNNDPVAGMLGHVVVGCLHQDMRGVIWTTY